jgi:tyrosinase
MIALRRRTDGPYPLDDTDKLEEASLAKFEAYLFKNPNKSTCTLENAAKRYEWYVITLTPIEISSTNLVKC